MKTAKQHRVIMRIELTESAKAEMIGYVDRTGMTQIACTSRLVEAFASWPEEIQGLLMGHYPAAIEQDVAELIIQHYAKGRNGAAKKKGGGK